MYHDHLVQLPDHFRADQKLKHVMKGIVQIPLKHRQVWGIDHLSRRPVPVCDNPLSKVMLHLHNFLLKKGEEGFIPWNSINFTAFDIFYLTTVCSCFSFLRFTSFKVNAIRNGSQGWWKQKKAQITHTLCEKYAANLSAVNSPILKKFHENT